MKKLIAFLLLSFAAFSSYAQTKINPAKLLQGNVGNTTYLASDLNGNVRFIKNLAPFFIFIGESNSEGRALNSSATATELAPNRNALIWNPEKGKNEALDIGTNNVWNYNSQFQTNKANWHGFELELANEAVTRINANPIYIVKCGQGGSLTGEWNSEAAGSHYNIAIGRIDSSIAELRANNVEPVIYILYSHGINDAIAGTSYTTVSNNMQSLISRLRTRYGANIPVFQTKIMRTDANYSAIDDTISAIADRDPLWWAIPTADASKVDPNHWDYEGMKLITSRMVTHALDSVGFNGRSGVPLYSVPSQYFTASSGVIRNDVSLYSKIIGKQAAAAAALTSAWQQAPLGVEAYNNASKKLLFYYDTYNGRNRGVIHALTEGTGHDTVEIYTSSHFLANNMTATNINATTINASAATISSLTASSVNSNFAVGFQSTSGTDQNNTILKVNYNFTKFGYFDWDNTTNTFIMGAVNNGVSHNDIALNYQGGNLNVGMLSGTRKFNVNGTGYFASSATATQFISTVATGTAPLSITSTTLVSNLNAQYVSGLAATDLGRLATSGVWSATQYFNTVVGRQASAAANSGESRTKSPIYAEAYNNTNKRIYLGYDTYNGRNRGLISVATEGVSNDTLEINSSSHFLVNNMTASTLKVPSVQSNIAVGFQSTSGTDQNNTIFKVNYDANKFGYFDWDNTTGTFIIGAVNSGVSHNDIALNYQGGNLNVGMLSGTRKFNVNGTGYFASTATATQFISTVATGTAPLSITSTTLVSNLNANFIRGLDTNVIAQRNAVNTFTSANTFNGQVAVGTTINPSYALTAANLKLTAGMVADGAVTVGSLAIPASTTSTTNTQVWSVGASGAVEKQNITDLKNQSTANVTVSATLNGNSRHSAAFDGSNYSQKSIKYDLTATTNNQGIDITSSNIKDGGFYILSFINIPTSQNLVFASNFKAENASTALGTQTITGTKVYLFVGDASGNLIRVTL